MCCRQFCGFRLARINQDDFSFALGDCFEPVLNIRRGHDAAVGGRRVCSEDQHVVRVVDVGDRDQQPMAKHQTGCQMMRQLIHRRRRESVARVEGLLKVILKQQRT